MASRTQQSKETKNIIAKAKREIKKGRNWREVCSEVEEMIPDSIQRQKARKSIIDWLPADAE